MSDGTGSQKFMIGPQKTYVRAPQLVHIKQCTGIIYQLTILDWLIRELIDLISTVQCDSDIEFTISLYQCLRQVTCIFCFVNAFISARESECTPSPILTQCTT